MSESHSLESMDPSNIRALVRERDATVLRAQQRARDRADIERRRAFVVRKRFVEAQMTAVQIVEAMKQLDPPIHTTPRTVERDIAAIKADGRRYLRADAFDTRTEVNTALLRFDLIARRATALAMTKDGPEGAVWARVALLASEAKTQLLERAGLIDPAAFRLPPDDSGKQATRIPSHAELFARFESITIPDGEIISEAERAWNYGDAAAADRLKRCPENER